MPTLNLIGRISLDSTQWKSGLSGLEKGFKPMADRLGGILNTAFSKNPLMGAVGAGAEALGLGKVFSFVEEKAEAMQERLRTILRGTAMTGLDAEIFQRLANVFTAAGSNAEAIARPMQALESALEKVRAGGPEAEKTFIALQKLGATWEEIAHGDTQAIFLSLFGQLRGAAADAGKLAALKAVFGKGGLELLPAAQIGLGSKAAEGGILSDEERADMEELKKQMAELKAFFRDTGLEAEKMAMQIAAAFSGLPRILSLGMKDLGGEMVLTDKGEAAIKALRERQAAAKARRDAEDLEKFRAAEKEKADRKIQDRINDKGERLRLARLTPEQRRKDLESQIRMHEALGDMLPLEDQEKLADLRLALQAVPKEKNLLEKLNRPTDQLVSIGNRLGEDPHSRASKDELVRIRETLGRIESSSRMRRGSELVVPNL